MRILITGIHGFVGSNLVAAFKDRFEIYGLDIVAPQKEGVVKTYSWDDLDKGGIPDFDAIVHLAGKAHDTKNESAAELYFRINTGLTRRIFDYYLLSTAKKFVFFSSVKAAADFVPGEILTEGIVPAPVGPYGESKIKAEEYILSKQVPAGKSVYILRPCMIHGPGNKGNLNLLYNSVRKGIPWPLGAFDNRRTFTSIDNLIFVICRLLEMDVASGIYHMADDEAISTTQLIKIICGTLGTSPRIWNLSRPLISICASVGTLLHLPLNKERLRKLTENYVVSNAKIKRALDIRDMPVHAEDGLVKTFKSFHEA